MGAVVVVIGANFAIPRWLPEYQPALISMAIGAVGAVLYAATSGFPKVLGIQRKGRRLLAVQVAAVRSNYSSRRQRFGLASAFQGSHSRQPPH